jgi:hypothetical protein
MGVSDDGDCSGGVSVCFSGADEDALKKEGRKPTCKGRYSGLKVEDGCKIHCKLLIAQDTLLPNHGLSRFPIVTSSAKRCASLISLNR